jgi:hypothetical protein
MPRNIMGGSKAKRGGNKHGGGGGSGGGRYAGVRRAAAGEMYAVALRVFGGGRGLVIGNDGFRRRLEIRGKFKGRNRRHNEVKAGGLILVGDREWSMRENTDTERVCDLLCVYDADETRQLSREGAINLAIFKEANSKFDDKGDDTVRFDNVGSTRQHEEGDDEDELEGEEVDVLDKETGKIVRLDGYGIPIEMDSEDDEDGYELVGPTGSLPATETRAVTAPKKHQTKQNKLWNDEDDGEIDADDI